MTLNARWPYAMRGTSIIEFETWLELGQEGNRGGLLVEIEGYNRDDCVSALRLRDWLEAQRGELVRELGEMPRPTVPEPEEREDSEAQKAVNELVNALLATVAESPDQMSHQERGRWLLAHLLNWHRREDKSFWWRYFHLVGELTDEERREEPDALGGLTLECSWPDPAPRARSTIYRFRFPPQDHAIRPGSSPHDPARENSVGTVVELDDEEGLIDIRLGTSQPPPSATSLVPFGLVGARPKPQSLRRLASWIIEHGIAAPGPYRAARDLLALQPPRLGQREGEHLVQEGEDAQSAARRLAATMHETYLAIQGPPGSGKSTLGAKMIVDLVATGKRIGVTANSHKVIGEMLAKVGGVAEERGVTVAIGQRINDEPTYPPRRAP